MPKDFQRTDRVAHEIQRLLAHYIQFELKDPRLSAMTTVTHVTVTRDLAYAKVYISPLTEDPQIIREILDTLTKASGYLRRLLAKELMLRVMPQLQFVHDTSMAYGNRLAKLIDDAVADDARKRHDTDDNE